MLTVPTGHELFVVGRGVPAAPCSSCTAPGGPVKAPQGVCEVPPPSSRTPTSWPPGSQRAQVAREQQDVQLCQFAQNLGKRSPPKSSRFCHFVQLDLILDGTSEVAKIIRGGGGGSEGTVVKFRTKFAQTRMRKNLVSKMLLHLRHSLCCTHMCVLSHSL